MRNKIFLDNLYFCIKGEVRNDETDLNTLWDIGFVQFARKKMKVLLKRAPKLSKAQKKQIQDFYGPYRRVTHLYHQVYTNEYGKFFPEYLPDELFYTDIDRFYNGREEARYLDNKCYYQQIFPNIRQPKMVAMHCGNNWLDEQGALLTDAQLVEKLQSESEVVLKIATNSEGGAGIRFLPGNLSQEEWEKILNTVNQDMVIQRVLKQHNELACLHESSVNTLRLLSILYEQEVKIYLIMLRIGVGDARVDNNSAGALQCILDEDGNFMEKAYFNNGDIATSHPDEGYRFKEQKLYHVDKAIELVKKAHPCVPHFRMVSWDIAIDEEGEAVLIEANLSLGGIVNVQCAKGPLFGDDTRRILDEVYGTRKKK